MKKEQIIKIKLEELNKIGTKRYWDWYGVSDELENWVKELIRELIKNYEKQQTKE